MPKSQLMSENPCQKTMERKGKGNGPTGPTLPSPKKASVTVEPSSLGFVKEYKPGTQLLGLKQIIKQRQKLPSPQ